MRKLNTKQINFFAAPLGGGVSDDDDDKEGEGGKARSSDIRIRGNYIVFSPSPIQPFGRGGGESGRGDPALAPKVSRARLLLRCELAHSCPDPDRGISLPRKVGARLFLPAARGRRLHARGKAAWRGGRVGSRLGCACDALPPLPGSNAGASEQRLEQRAGVCFCSGGRQGNGGAGSRSERGTRLVSRPAFLPPSCCLGVSFCVPRWRLGSGPSGRRAGQVKRRDGRWWLRDGGCSCSYRALLPFPCATGRDVKTPGRACCRRAPGRDDPFVLLARLPVQK